MAFEQFQGIVLCEFIHIVGIFHLIENLNYLPRSKCHAQAHSCAAPRFREGLQHYQIGQFVQSIEHGGLSREVDIGFIDYHNAILGTAADIGKQTAVEGISGGVVGRANPYSARILVDGGNQSIGIERKIAAECHLAIFHIVDVGAHLIHAVAGRDSHHIIHSGAAKCAIHHIDALIASHAEEYVFLSHAFQSGYGALHLHLQRVGITVIGLIERIFVGIEPHTCLALKFASRRTVWLEIPNIRSYYVLEIHILLFE